jgi:hypothetical protein
MSKPFRKSEALSGIFDVSVHLPDGLTIDHLEQSMITVRRIFQAINQGLQTYGMPKISELLRHNQYSGMVSDFMTRALDMTSEFKKLANTDFPDLQNKRTGTGLEVKASMRDPWSTVGHNVASGWFLTVEYDIDESGLPDFRTVWIGELSESDFLWRGRSETSKRTITASVKRDSWNRKMKKVFQRSFLDRFIKQKSS